MGLVDAVAVTGTAYVCRDGHAALKPAGGEFTGCQRMLQVPHTRGMYPCNKRLREVPVDADLVEVTLRLGGWQALDDLLSSLATG